MTNARSVAGAQFIRPSRIWAYALLCLLTAAAQPCTLVRGYFYQVTSLRGAVVGVDRGDPRHEFEWWRHRVTRANLTLKLLPYGLSWEQEMKMKPIKQVVTGKGGYFDFGTIPAGHYKLLIDTPWKDWETDRYDVEIISGPKRNKSVLIDISPINPDCTGGHQFFAFAE